MTTYLENLTQSYRAVRARLFGCRPPPSLPVPKKCPRVPDDWFDSWCDEWGAPKLTGAEAIEREVCEKHGVTLLDLRSDRRKRSLVRARHEAMWRMRHETYMSLPAIAARFRRDHTTALHGIKRHQQRIDAGEA